VNSPKAKKQSSKTDSFLIKIKKHKKKIVIYSSIFFCLLVSVFLGFSFWKYIIRQSKGIRQAEIFQQSSVQDQIIVNPVRTLLPISDTFFGINLYWSTHGMESSSSGYDYADDVFYLLKDLRLNTLRFPGGCAAETYQWKWKLGVEPYDRDVPPSYNEWFSYGMGIDHFIILLKNLGISPYYTVNIEEGHLNPDNCVGGNEYPGTIQEAQELAQYFKTNFPEETVFWELGNEPWGWPNWTLEDYVARAKLYAEAIEEVYPNSRFTWSWAVRDTTPDEAEGRWREFIQYFAKNTSLYFDALQFHDYYGLFKKEDTFTIDRLAKERLDSLRKLLDEAGENIGIDVTEFNIWCGGQPACGTVAHSLGIAQIYRQYLLHGVEFTHIHGGVMESNQGSEHSWASIVSGGGPVWDRINKPPRPQPIYYVQKLLADHIGDEIIESQTNIANVDILTSRKGNTFYVLVINKNNSVKSLPIRVDSSVNLKHPARVYVVGKGSQPHDLYDLGAKEIRSGYVDISDNVVDFYAEPYSVSVIEVDYDASSRETYNLYRGFCPSLHEYLISNDKSELEGEGCQQIQVIGKTYKNQTQDTEKLQRYWINLGEHYQTATADEKEHLLENYGAAEDRELGYVYTKPREGTIPLYQMWCGDGWLKKHFFTANEKEKQNVMDQVNFPTWKCVQAAVVGYLLP
jgi:alpha-L-arabinofuranosidase